MSGDEFLFYLRFGQPVVVSYRNWRGETAVRKIEAISLWYGSTEWHPVPGWLLRAWDYDKKAERDFALDGFLLAERSGP